MAAIDCGTNSIRLLVADCERAGSGARLHDVVREMQIVRLGEGVDRTGRFAPAALLRTFTALDAYAEQVRALGVEAVRMVATSASRDVTNRSELVEGVRARLGIEPDIVSGDEEAALSFRGATAELVGDRRVAAPYLVCDIGGGSTEFILGSDGQVRAARSVDVGCVRMSERHLHTDPPTTAQVAAATQDIDAALGRAAEVVPLREAATLVGLAGSVTTVAAIALDLTSYDPAQIHHARLTAEQVHQVSADLLAMTRAQRAALPVMHPGRVDVIAAGALVLDRIMRRCGVADVLVSEHDILDGIALTLADG